MIILLRIYLLYTLYYLAYIFNKRNQLMLAFIQDTVNEKKNNNIYSTTYTWLAITQIIQYIQSSKHCYTIRKWNLHNQWSGLKTLYKFKQNCLIYCQQLSHELVYSLFHQEILQITLQAQQNKASAAAIIEWRKGSGSCQLCTQPWNQAFWALASQKTNSVQSKKNYSQQNWLKTVGLRYVVHWTNSINLVIVEHWYGVCAMHLWQK